MHVYTCIAGSDYEALSVNESFPVGSMIGDTVCIGITILDDQSFESTEFFTLDLLTDPDVWNLGPVVNVQIIDDDGM